MAQPKRRESKSPSSPAPATGPTLAPSAPDSLEPSADAWPKPERLSRAGWAVLAGVVVLVNLPLLHYLVRSEPEATVALPYQNSFEDPSSIKRDFFTTGGFWRVQGGELLSPGVRNNPLWLKARLPQNVRIDFDARSMSPEGDIRAIVFGDGLNYQLSGYHLIQGGWNNGLSVLARLDENAPTLSRFQAWATDIGRRRGESTVNWVEEGLFNAGTKVRVETSGRAAPGQRYHWTIERRGSLIRWSIDGEPYLEFNDPWPLTGKEHDRFGFVSVESDLYFDNLRIEAIDGNAPFPARPAAPKPPSVEAGPFSDKFDRPALGPNWLATDPAAVRLDRGAVLIERAHNHPLWLARPIPANASIEFDCWTESPEGDIKVEAWGDGHSFHGGDPYASYTSTGYVFVFGGWKNSASAIAKQQEHGSERSVRSDLKVQPGQRYHWQIRRSGGQIAWRIDGKEFLTLSDPAPLDGPGHQYFAFSGWESPVHFSNLRIEPL